MKNARSCFAIVVAFVLLACLVLPITFYLINRPRIPNAPLPSPNAYDTVDQASQATTAIPLDFAETNDTDALIAFVNRNQTALKLIDQSLDQPCVVRVDYESGLDEILERAAYNRPATRLLIAKARLGALTGDDSAAAMDYAKVVLLNSKLTNGGVLVHVGGALACEAYGLEGLVETTPRLTSDERKPIQAMFNRAKRKAIDLDALVARESTLLKVHHGTIRGTIISSSLNTTSPFVQQTKQADDQNQQLYLDVQSALDLPPSS
ncbi:hypothetical protein [Planctomycetes bacterium K23_9]|uniref:Uncharacterized protein n=1 Tax=Stieleria marina TaxID=1930275 RepID=A0A517NWS9_9BACT|nr:hypothetical protein K239x_35870 [Planctomycetes bacterium K23_9]